MEKRERGVREEKNIEEREIERKTNRDEMPERRDSQLVFLKMS
jgi:hypothetical protein